MAEYIAKHGPQTTEAAAVPCQTPGCSACCAHAYSCHELRMGRRREAVWPLIALGVVILLGMVM